MALIARSYRATFSDTGLKSFLIPPLRKGRPHDRPRAFNPYLNIDTKALNHPSLTIHGHDCCGWLMVGLTTGTAADTSWVVTNRPPTTTTKGRNFIADSFATGAFTPLFPDEG